MSFAILETILCVLLAALAVTLVFRRLKLPIILGYFLVGAFLGPNALAIIPNSEVVNDLAEFGIVFLMFTVGLEFSQAKLFALKKAVFLLGGLQIILCVFITLSIGLLLHSSLSSAIIVGGILAMSSTAIVLKQLDEQFELHTQYGLDALGILLFQDLAVIPFFILISGLAKTTTFNLPIIFLYALIKGAIAIFLITMIGRFFLKPLFQMIAKSKAIELFTLMVLLIALTAAWLTNLFGLSYALGALIAGIMLSETEFRHQIEIEIRPFRDILLGLFFISLGMLIKVKEWQLIWPWVLILVTALMLGKILLITAISFLSGNRLTIATRTGLILAQGGEFGFALLTLALGLKLLPEDFGQVILAALLISIALAPILIRFNKEIAYFLTRSGKQFDDESNHHSILQKAESFKNHVIICGYGRVGQQIARMLSKAKAPYIGLDIDVELINSATLAGENALFGDASHPSILKAAGIDRARALVISFDKLKPATRILEFVRKTHEHLPILVRCKDQDELDELKKYHPTKIIVETFEESLTLSQYLLKTIQLSPRKIVELMEKARSKNYDILRKIFPSSFDEEISEESLLHENLMAVQLVKSAYAVGHSLKEFDFETIGVEIIAIRRRGKGKQLKPHANLILAANDIIIIYGASANNEDAERIFLQGR